MPEAKKSREAVIEEAQIQAGIEYDPEQDWKIPSTGSMSRRRRKKRKAKRKTAKMSRIKNRK